MEAAKPCRSTVTQNLKLRVQHNLNRSPCSRWQILTDDLNKVTPSYNTTIQPMPHHPTNNAPTAVKYDAASLGQRGRCMKGATTLYLWAMYGKVAQHCIPVAHQVMMAQHRASQHV